MADDVEAAEEEAVDEDGLLYLAAIAFLTQSFLFRVDLPCSCLMSELLPSHFLHNDYIKFCHQQLTYYTPEDTKVCCRELAPRNGPALKLMVHVWPHPFNFNARPFYLAHHLNKKGCEQVSAKRLCIIYMNGGTPREWMALPLEAKG